MPETLYDIAKRTNPAFYAWLMESRTKTAEAVDLKAKIRKCLESSKFYQDRKKAEPEKQNLFERIKTRKLEDIPEPPRDEFDDWIERSKHGI